MNSSRPLLSIVMPLFNHESFVAPAIRSVLDQTYENIELIIIDDCSTDQSLARAKDVMDDRIKMIVHSENVGAHATINEGISLARGEYVSVINSDDVYAPRRLETLYRRCAEEGVNLAGTTITLIDSAGNIVDDPSHWWRLWYDDLVKCYVETRDLYLSLLRGNVFITSSNFFFRKSLIEKVGSFHSFRYVHDYEFVLRALTTTGVQVAFYEDEPFLQYRLHSSNSIRANAKEANRETFDVLIAYGAWEHTRDPQKVVAALLSHLQKIRQHIEDTYRAEQSHTLAEQRRYEEEQEKRWIAIQEECVAIKGELTENQRNLNQARTEVEFLRNEVAKISATRGYRLEKKLYNIYSKLKNLGRDSAGN